MERRKFLKRFGIGSAAIVVSPKIIAEVTKPMVVDLKLEYQKCIASKEYFYRNYWMAVALVRPGYVFTVGTAGENDPNSFDWVERIPTGEYGIIRTKARRKGYNSHFTRYYEEFGKFPYPILDK